MRGGKFTHPKLVKIEAGRYYFDGRYVITCYGYNRIVGHVRWHVSKNDDRLTSVTECDTLTDAVHYIERMEAKGGAA
ncbi:MAG: hypothetical protein J6Z49_06830 [Kiritimatiellae bacterium]|nr:hypothetical protein [Kiritimatiellia bacterium]